MLGAAPRSPHARAETSTSSRHQKVRKIPFRALQIRPGRRNRCRFLRNIGAISVIHKKRASKWGIGDTCGLGPRARQPGDGVQEGRTRRPPTPARTSRSMPWRRRLALETMMRFRRPARRVAATSRWGQCLLRVVLLKHPSSAAPRCCRAGRDSPGYRPQLEWSFRARHHRSALSIMAHKAAPPVRWSTHPAWDGPRRRTLRTMTKMTLPRAKRPRRWKPAPPWSSCLLHLDHGREPFTASSLRIASTWR